MSFNLRSSKKKKVEKASEIKVTNKLFPVKKKQIDATLY